MPFWGVEVKQGRPYTHVYDKANGRLRVCQATLGNESADFATQRVLVQCSVGHRTPVLLCSLQPDGAHSSPVGVEFEESEEVIFSVIGPWSVHLTGYYLSNNSSANHDIEPYGEDIADTESGESNLCSEEDKYEDSFINDHDLDVCPLSSVSNGGEFMLEDEKYRNGSFRRLKKKCQLNESDEGNSFQSPAALPVSEINPGRSSKSMKRKKECSKDRKAHAVDRANHNNVSQDEAKAENVGRDLPEHAQGQNSANDESLEISGKQLEKIEKKKKKMEKNKKTKGNMGVEVPPPSTRETTGPLGENLGNANPEPCQDKILSNGLVIKELELGEADGKVASHGKKVRVHFTGKLQEGDQIIGSNIGKIPLKFRLGGREVIKGWNIGLDGMRVGGKRSLIIPPSLGYGSEGDGDKVPPNSWLVYDIELVKVH